MAMNSIRSVVDVHSVGMDETSLQWMMLTALRCAQPFHHALAAAGTATANNGTVKAVDIVLPRI